MCSAPFTKWSRILITIVLPELAGWCEEDISYVARDKGGSIVGIGLACFLDRLSGDNTSLNEPTERYSDKVEKIRCFINTLEDKVIRAVNATFTA